MRRRHGDKWTRNRYHQVEETVIGSRQEHSANTFTKRKTARKERRSINMQCHRARLNPDPGLDIHTDPGRPGWDYFCTPWVRYVAQKGEMPRMYGSPHSPEIELTTEELHRLPRWAQHQIRDNIVRAGDTFRCIWGYWQLPEYEQKHINNRTEADCYNYILDLQDEERHQSKQPEEKDSPDYYYRPHGSY